MRYRFLAAGLALSLVISCASCGKKKTDESSAERIDEETVNSNGREGSSEPSSNQPMTPEEIASLAHSVRWFDYFSREKSVEWGLKEEICIEEFPDVLFQWTTFADTYEFGSRITATTDQGTEEILKESVILSVYFCDLTGDGMPELCSTVSFGSGNVDYHIIVYDYIQKKSYVLKDRMKYDYILRADQGKLYVDKYAYSVFENETPEETGIPMIKDGQLQFLSV
ncbi:MAG: hypothetical protein IK106_03535 [Clostridiales bacterium]|nr:hypothetical protein [Clostridiales bacterium]